MSAEPPTVGVIVVAAGSGLRLGLGTPKAFVDLAGRTVLDRALDPVRGLGLFAVAVVPADRLQDVPDGIVAVAGGATRQASVAAGLAALPPSVQTVLVHDAARALTPASQFQEVIDEVRETGDGIVPYTGMANTVKRIGEDGFIVGTADRSSFAMVATPQGFPREVLERAYAAATSDETDDSALVTAIGHPVRVILGDPLDFKITTKADLARAEAIVGSPRTGVGYDVHAYDESVPLWLGGLEWPGEPGLRGHSDGDAVIHAIVDALLSAASLGDIGSRFGTDRPEFAGARSDVFLEHTLRLLHGAGYRVGNVAVQVVGAHPKIGPRRTELEAHLSAMVGAPVAVTATTSDGLGFTGAEGLGAIATALLIPWKR